MCHKGRSKIKIEEMGEMGEMRKWWCKKKGEILEKEKCPTKIKIDEMGEMGEMGEQKWEKWEKWEKIGE